MQPIGVMYATAGGRYPFMAGVAEALEMHLAERGYNIVFRMGASGGSLISALHSTGTAFETWLNRAATPTRMGKMKLGGLSSLSNAFNYFSKGGFLPSNKIEEIFEDTFFTKPIKDELLCPTYAVSWCDSAEKPVAFRLTPENLSSRVAASCALPVGISPVKIQNKNLEPRIQEVLKVTDNPEGYSTFRDGGLCSGFPLRMIEGMVNIPVVVVTIDVRVPGEDRGHINIIHKLMAKELQVKILDNISEIADRRSLSVFCVPCPEFINRKYAVKFDLSFDQGMEMYNAGRTLAESQLWIHPLRLPTPVAVATPEPIAVDLKPSQDQLST